MKVKREFPLARVYGLLEPGPVVLVTTARAGRTNVMPMSWHTMMKFVPPLVAVSENVFSHRMKRLRSKTSAVRQGTKSETAR